MMVLGCHFPTTFSSETEILFSLFRMLIWTRVDPCPTLHDFYSEWLFRQIYFVEGKRPEIIVVNPEISKRLT